MKKSIGKGLVKALIAVATSFAAGVMYEQGRKQGQSSNFMSGLSSRMGGTAKTP